MLTSSGIECSLDHLLQVHCLWFLFVNCAFKKKFRNFFRLKLWQLITLSLTFTQSCKIGADFANCNCTTMYLCNYTTVISPRSRWNYTLIMKLKTQMFVGLGVRLQFRKMGEHLSTGLTSGTFLDLTDFSVRFVVKQQSHYVQQQY